MRRFVIRLRVAPEALTQNFTPSQPPAFPLISRTKHLTTGTRNVYALPAAKAAGKAREYPTCRPNFGLVGD